MKDKIEVSMVRINIGKKALLLSPKELIELRDILNETFPEKEKDSWKISYLSLMPQPIYIERPIYPRHWEYWTETYYCNKTLELTSNTTTNMEVIENG